MTVVIAIFYWAIIDMMTAVNTFIMMDSLYFLPSKFQYINSTPLRILLISAYIMNTTLAILQLTIL